MVVFTAVVTCIVVAFIITMWLCDRHDARGPYGQAINIVPRLCRESASPERPAEGPEWPATLLTVARGEFNNSLEVRCVLPDLLGGTVEVAIVRSDEASAVVVRCPRVRPPRELTRGVLVAATHYVGARSLGLCKIATIKPRRPGNSRVKLWIQPADGPPVVPGDAAELALLEALNVAFWVGLDTIEFHDGEVFLVFDGLGRRRLRSTHIAAICEALDVADPERDHPAVAAHEG